MSAEPQPEQSWIRPWLAMVRHAVAGWDTAVEHRGAIRRLDEYEERLEEIVRYAARMEQERDQALAELETVRWSYAVLLRKKRRRRQLRRALRAKAR